MIEEPCLFFRRTWVQFPEHTRQLVTVSNSSSRESDAVSPSPLTRCLNGEQTCMQGKHPYAMYDLDRMFVTHGKDQNLNPGTHIKLDMAVRWKSRQEDPQKLACAVTTRRYFWGGGAQL